MGAGFELGFKTKVFLIGAIIALPSALADTVDPKTLITNLKSGGVLKFKESKGSIPYGEAKKGTTFPKIVIVPEIQARDITFERAKSFVQGCYSGSRISQVASLVVGALAGVDNVGADAIDKRSPLKLYARNNQKGENETGSAEALYALIKSRMPGSWPRDGRVEDDVESYTIDQHDCLRKNFTTFYAKMMKDSPSCEVHFYPASAFEGKSLDLKSIQSLTLMAPVKGANGWIDFNVSKPTSVKMFSCSGDVKTVADLSTIIDAKKSVLKAVTPPAVGAVSGAPGVHIGNSVKILPYGGPTQTKTKTGSSVQSKDAVTK